MGSLGLSLLAGSLTTLNPCVFPILPLVVGAAVQANRLAPLFMGLGMATAFASLGILTALLADAIGFDQESVRQGTALLLIVLGVTMVLPQAKGLFSRLVSPLANKANDLSGSLPQGSVLGAFGMGMLLGLIWTPCSGPLLASTLSLAASEGPARAGVMLGVFGLGAALPLVSIGYLSRSTLGRLRQWVLQHGDRAQQIMGGLLVAVGLLVITGADKVLEAWLVQLMPQAWLDLTTRF
jgi:cytochrome c biogenesis protein CcdA